MIFYDKDNYFDFSITVYDADGISYIDDDIPEIIDDELVNLFHQALRDYNEIEYRFEGKMDNDTMMISNCYKKNGYVWENIYYDELIDILNEVKHLDGVHRIINCLEYCSRE